MTREGGKILLPVIKAFIEGKTIQHYESRLGSWYDLTGVDLSFSDDPSFYRIKPEPKYRPFKTKEECWNEMQKHQPFCWIISNKFENFEQITYVGPNIISMSDKNSYFSTAFEDYKFVDGSPFGIKEE